MSNILLKIKDKVFLNKSFHHKIKIIMEVEEIRFLQLKNNLNLVVINIISVEIKNKNKIHLKIKKIQKKHQKKLKLNNKI